MGTQGEPFYEGWFLQLLMNRGDGTFADETRDRVRRNDWFRGTVRAETTAPWAQRVVVLDFNGDGAADFTIRFSGGPFQWPGNQPLVWLNDGAGRFTALRVDDFLQPGMDEWIFASTLRRRDRSRLDLSLFGVRFASLGRPIGVAEGVGEDARYPVRQVVPLGGAGAGDAT